MLDILLIDDEPEIRDLLEEQLTEAGYRVQAAADGEEGTQHLRRQTFDVVPCDVRLPRLDGLTLLRRIQHETPTTDVILMTAYARTTLVGQSPGIRRVRELVPMVAQSDAPTLVTGESGTGKEVVARAIHESGPRRDKPFVAVNCGALADNLVEAELFGHERGAFTGAVAKRDGRFKADEVAELPPGTQAKLIRVLQEGVFEPLGTNTPVRVDVRIVSATHRNLAERIKNGAFREDLLYRINVIDIRMPPLRERPGDLPLLLRHFLQRMTTPGAPLPSVSAGAWAALAQHPFMGNVRELSHALEHALVLSGGGDIDLEHLPPSIGRPGHSPQAELDIRSQDVRPLHVVVRDFEHDYLRRVLKAADGKRSRTAELLGISRKTLWDKLRQDCPGETVRPRAERDLA